ncbi:MAG: sulfatase-like hydrolase/transferase, partial [Bacteroidaceae bacterium]|nr:sulfatase-like hydrolase/transferase [Bacteroidaceae bacterium]
MKTGKSVLSALALLPCMAAQAQSRPNILFVLCDDMGWGDLGCYGQHYIRTPHIDRLAGEGMQFMQAYAGSPVSAPSRASLMTGQHTGHTHIRGNREYWRGVPMVQYGQNADFSRVGQHPLDTAHVVIPEIMKAAGYRTAQFGKWAGGYEGSESTPDRRGVDEFYGYICQFQAHLYYPNFLNDYRRDRGDTEVSRQPLPENYAHAMYGPDYRERTVYSADTIHRRAMEWLDRQTAEQPFFGMFTYTLPHA